MKWLTVQAAATANGDSIIIGSEGKPPLLSSWKCSRCGTVLYVGQTKETSPEACHRPCPYCPATTGQDMSQGLTLSLTRWECTCGAVWLTNSIQTQADVLPACPSCVSNSNLNLSERVKVVLDWICIRCKAIWWTGLEGNSCADPELMSCICCPCDVEDPNEDWYLEFCGLDGDLHIFLEQVKELRVRFPKRVRALAASR
jgi:hypothetical protein